MKVALDDMPINDVIELYNEKHRALHQGDMTKLISLKNQCPDIFDKATDDQIRDMIQYAQEFQGSARYRELQRQEIRKRLSIIKCERC